MRVRTLRRQLVAVVTAPALATVLLPAAASPADASTSARTSGVNRVIKDSRVVESSGLARSTYRRTTLFTHNDSGDGPRVFAVGRRGATRATLKVGGASAVDWEDIASGPRHKLWVADIGDNGRRRSTISVYRFREPRHLHDRTVDATRFDLRYPGGPRDAEAIMVNPRSGRLFVVSKESGGGSIYRAPRRLSTSRVNVLERVGPAPATVTAASYSPNGRRFALSTYTAAYLYRGVKDRTPRRIGLPSTKQGESLEISRRGNALFRGSEGYHSPVYKVPLG